jgi:hypothetical protein
MGSKPDSIDYSQVKPAGPKVKDDTMSVKVSNTGPRKYKNVLTPEKEAANKAAGQNSNIGKVVTNKYGTTIDYTQVKKVTPKGTQAGHAVTSVNRKTGTPN